MHTYYTALPFTPRHTRFYRLYKQETHHSITVLQGLDPLWTSCLANLVMKDDTSIVRVSPDGTRLVLELHRSVRFCRVSHASCLVYKSVDRRLCIDTGFCTVFFDTWL